MFAKQKIYIFWDVIFKGWHNIKIIFTVSLNSNMFNYLRISVSTDTCVQYVEYLLSSFIFGFIFFLLAARSRK